MFGIWLLDFGIYFIISRVFIISTVVAKTIPIIMPINIPHGAMLNFVFNHRPNNIPPTKARAIVVPIVKAKLKSLFIKYYYSSVAIAKSRITLTYRHWRSNRRPVVNEFGVVFAHVNATM